MSKPPLERYRVIDFGTAYAGGMVGQLLADMGAQVIRVESREKLDGMRLGWPGKGAPPDPELNTQFHALNRNKMSVTANMKTEEGLGLVRGLITQSDVVYDNFTPGVLERVGLDYNSLTNLRPDIVCVSLPSAGMYGPYKDVRTYASTLGALAGIESLVGYPGGRVLSLNSNYGDANSAVHGVIAILLALIHRDRTGEGQFVDLSQWEAATCLLSEPLMEHAMNGDCPGPQGNLHRSLVPHNNYPCKAKDTWVSIAVDSEEEWLALCQGMGSPLWSEEERFGDKYSRLKHREALDELISEWTSSFSCYEVAEVLRKAGVAAMPIMNADERFNDPHFRQRRLYEELEHPRTGLEPVHGIPWKLSATPGAVRRHAPLLGEHNKHIYSELLGLPEDMMARLEEIKAFY
ncbi:MAG: CoA transferase [Chloroflexi bacterium]|nr:CoA transferase [Chloroflexota bacterium]